MQTSAPPNKQAAGTSNLLCITRRGSARNVPLQYKQRSNRVRYMFTSLLSCVQYEFCITVFCFCFCFFFELSSWFLTTLLDWVHRKKYVYRTFDYLISFGKRITLTSWTLNLSCNAHIRTLTIVTLNIVSKSAVSILYENICFFFNWKNEKKVTPYTNTSILLHDIQMQFAVLFK